MAHVSGPHRLGRGLKEEAASDLGRSEPLPDCDRCAQESALPSAGDPELGWPCPGCWRRHS